MRDNALIGDDSAKVSAHAARFAFVECLAEESDREAALMQAARDRQLSRHIVGADSREGGEGKRHEVCHGGSLIARRTHETHTSARWKVLNLGTSSRFDLLLSLRKQSEKQTLSRAKEETFSAYKGNHSSRVVLACSPFAFN